MIFVNFSKIIYLHSSKSICIFPILKFMMPNHSSLTPNVSINERAQLDWLADFSKSIFLTYIQANLDLVMEDESILANTIYILLAYYTYIAYIRSCQHHDPC